MLNYPNSIIEKKPSGEIVVWCYVSMDSKALSDEVIRCQREADEESKREKKPYFDLYVSKIESLLNRPDVMSKKEPSPWVKSQTFYSAFKALVKNQVFTSVVIVQHENSKNAHVFLCLRYNL